MAIKLKHLLVIEALLFLIPKEHSIEEICKRLHIKPDSVKKIISTLMERYNNNEECVIGIKEINGKYIMHIKDKYVDIIKAYIKEAELNMKEMEILGIIIKKRSILKSQIAKALGSSAYKSIKSLVNKGFIFEKKIGRTSVLYPTDKALLYYKKM